MSFSGSLSGAASGPGVPRWPLAVVLLAGVYVAGTGAVLFAPAGDPVATWWPAAGLAVVLVSLSPTRRWWLLALGLVVVTTAANVSGGRALGLSLWFGVANAAEALVVSGWLRRGRDRLPALDSLEDFVRLVGAVVLGGATIATIAAAGLAVSGDGDLRSWPSVFAAHAASTLTIVPAAMATGRHPRRWGWQLPLQAATLLVITLAVFSPDQSLSLTFVPLPFLVWGALRFDVATVAWELVAFAVLVTSLTARGDGPFGYDYERGNVGAGTLGALAQAYLVCAALMALPLVIAIAQRRRLHERVTRSELLFRRNFTESLTGMLLMRRGTRAFEIVDLNESAARMLGGSPLGRGLGEVLDSPDLVHEAADALADRLAGGDLDGWRVQSGLRDRPGARINVVVSLLASDPDPVFAAQLQEVTAEYDARARLEAAEKLTSATLDTTAALILVSDLYGEVVRVNGAATSVTGFAEDELVGQAIWELPFAPPGSIGYPAGLPEDRFSQVSRETDVVTKDGGRRRVLWNTSYVRDEHDRARYVVLTGTDLTAERTAAGLNRHLLQAAMTTALIGIDPAGRVSLFNAGAVNLLGYDAQDRVGTPFTDLLDPAELAERCDGATGTAAFTRLVAGLGSAGETAPRDWTWIGSDGSRHTVAMTLSVAADAIAARVGYLCVGRDVTETRASQQMLVAALDKERLAVERLRQLDQAKNEFVSTVSHELRTPVTSIVGYTEMLEDGSVGAPTPEQRPLLTSIARNGQRLILLCDDLLTLGGLDAGATRWDRGTVDLAATLPAVEEALRPTLAGRDLEVSLEAGTEAVKVLGEREQLERVLINLVGNAVKFTEDGGRVECRVEQRDGEARVTVSDTGIGIPAEEQAGLFQRFFRSSTAQQRAIQGTGLGLSIVAAIVAAHGGRIEVRSAHLEGTTFVVRLPLAR